MLEMGLITWFMHIQISNDHQMYLFLARQRGATMVVERLHRLTYLLTLEGNAVWQKKHLGNVSKSGKALFTKFAMSVIRCLWE